MGGNQSEVERVHISSPSTQGHLKHLSSQGNLREGEPASSPPPKTGLRGIVYRLVKHPAFDRFITFVILVNCILLAMEDPASECKDDVNCDGLQRVVFLSEFVFLAIYTVEALLKLFALRIDYFKDGWNWLDFIVVVLSYLSFVPGVGKYQALRTIRLLRALRSFSQIPAMREVVSSMMKALPLLVDVLVMCSFMLVVFSIFGLQLFSGKLRQYCSTPEGEFPEEPDHCSLSSGGFQCDPQSNYSVCMRAPSINDNPNGGITNFDNFGFALLTVFQLTSAEGWTEIMYWTMDATSDWCVIYFLATIFVGSLIVISLVFAAMESKWGGDDEEEEEEEEDQGPNLLARILAVLGKLPPCLLLSHIRLEATGPGRVCNVLIRTKTFEYLVFLAIVGNTLVLALYRSSMTSDEESSLDLANVVFTFFFAGEMVLKLFGLGFKGYASDGMNLFDGFIVVISLVEFGVASSGQFSVFRALRLLRLLKLVRSWRSLQRMVGALFASAKASASLSMVLLLVLYIFALFGKEFFGKKLEVNDERFNYDDIGRSFISVFVVLSGENWNSLMYEAANNEGKAYVVFFVLLLMIGNYVILNLFIAIILDQLVHAVVNEDDDEEGRDEASMHEAKLVAKIWNAITGGNKTARQSEPEEEEMMPPVQKTPALKFQVPTAPEGEVWSPRRTRTELLRAKFDEFDANKSGFVDEREVKGLLEFFGIELTMLEYHVIFADDRFTFDEFMDLMNKYEITISEEGVVSRMGQSAKFTAAEKKLLAKFDLDPELMVSPNDTSQDRVFVEGKSFYIFSKQSITRHRAVALAENTRFNNFILACIVASTIAVALDEPGRSKNFQDTLKVIDTIFVAIFMFELLVRTIAMGFFMGKHSYLQNSHFNKLDFVVVVLSFATLFISDGSGGSQVASLKALRAFRALRPLRTVGRIKSLRVVVNALMQAALPTLNALGLLAFFYLMFAILGVNLFNGKFHYCRVLEAETVPENPPTCPEVDFARGMCANGRCRADDCFPCVNGDGDFEDRAWVNYVQNFDNVINGMVLLFEMSTLEGWPTIALQAVDFTGSDTWPDEDHSLPRILFFIVFIIVGTFFIANLFASVAVDKYQRMTEFYNGMLFLTDKQKVWVMDSKQVVAARPLKIITTPLVDSLEPVVRSAWFDNVVLVCIMANIVTLGMVYEGMSGSYESVLSAFNVGFVIIFAVEMVLKVLGLGPEPYIQDHWNKFDFTVVVVSIVGLVTNVGPVASVFRVFRVARVLKLIPKAQRLMVVVQTVYLSLPALFNVAMLTALFFVIYACLGISLFGEVVYGDFLDRHANFRTFPVAMLTLFRVATGEDWNGIMHDTALKKGEIGSGGQTCSSAEENCGIDIVSQIYFVSFNVIAAYMMLNMVLAAVVTQYEITSRTDEGLSNNMIDEFKRAWYRFDPDAVARIQASDFDELYNLVAPIFRFPPEDREKFRKKCEDSGGELRFSEVLFVFAFEAFGTTLGATMPGRELEQRIERKKRELDDDPKDFNKPMLPQLTEWQLLEMSPDDLREELRKRGHVRRRNRSSSAAHLDAQPMAGDHPHQESIPEERESEPRLDNDEQQ